VALIAPVIDSVKEQLAQTRIEELALHPDLRVVTLFLPHILVLEQQPLSRPENAFGVALPDLAGVGSASDAEMAMLQALQASFTSVEEFTIQKKTRRVEPQCMAHCPQKATQHRVESCDARCPLLLQQAFQSGSGGHHTVPSTAIINPQVDAVTQADSPERPLPTEAEPMLVVLAADKDQYVGLTACIK
jgi:hypothetical protein